MSAPPGEGEAVVLVVEDDPASIRLVEEAFAHLERPVTPVVATDGVEAFDVLYNRGEYEDAPTPDLVVLDLHLPQKQGQQVLAEMRDDEGVTGIPVVVFSQTDDPGTIAECYRLGANAYVVKPMDYEGMRTTVDRLTAFWLGTAATPPADAIDAGEPVERRRH